MNKKMLISLMLIGVLTFAIGMGTFAYFTSTATSEDNVFTAGTLKIEGPGDNFAAGMTSINNVYPGWEESKVITVDNIGTLPFKFRMVRGDISGDLTTGSNPLQIKINDGAWMNIGDFTNVVLSDADGLAPEDAPQEITVSFRLPTAADNFYQGKTASLNFSFDATQVTNPGWNEAGN